MAKATNAEIEIRVNKVIQLLILNTNRHDILKYFRTKLNIDISIKSIDIYIRNAKRIIKKKAKYNIDEQVGKAIARLDDLYLKAYMIQDYKTCLSIQKEINNLLGLITQKVDLTTAGEPLEPVTIIMQGEKKD